jgi:hypothetical protein
MLWQEIREKHPKKWLVIEAKKFHQADDKFVIKDLEVLDIFDKSFDAYDEYRKLHRKNPSNSMIKFLVFQEYTARGHKLNFFR